MVVYDLLFINYVCSNQKANCLRDTVQTTALEIASSTLPGQRYSADDQCALMHGTG
jgi:hypothetical protein